MRVITGSARGKRLKELPGLDTRPTTDRVKEGLFSAIQFDIEGRRVLDLFAGTGQLGIEALSRGAQSCDFVERDRAAYAVAEKNIRAARVADRAALHRAEAAEFVARAAGRKFDLIFLDPPYGGKILENILLQIETFDILSTNGIIICESAVEDRFAHGFALVRERRYGATLITVLQRQDGGTDEQNEDSDLPGQL